MSDEGRPAGPLAPTESQPQHYDEQQLDDRQFDELCQRYAPSHLSARRPQWVAAAPAVAQKTILEIRFDKGYPEFSDGIGVNNATDAASGVETRMSRRMRKKLARAAV